MHINEVERLVDITKKNIRFYEEQGLLQPARNEGNRYREYSEEDVAKLKKIKLLRMLGVPISEIRRVIEENIPLEDCLERHMISLRRQEKSLQKMQEMCREIMDAREIFSEIDAESYLIRMNEMEKEGVMFVETKKEDKRSKKKSAIIAGSVMILLMILCICLFAWCAWGVAEDPMPVGMFIAFSLGIIVVIVGVLLSLRMRLKEIEKGEIYEASKY
ncbi:MAG: MerR family transcriptional regulator [Clostridiales bacterium]|nr:MerR family transcriptional regulator [Clostridiales bacterium]